MEVTYPSSILQRDVNSDQNTAEMELDGRDLDIDLGSIDDFNESAAVPDKSSEYTDPSSQVLDSELIPNKVHVRGLEDLTTSDIKAFSAEHYSSEAPLRVEWIDDTSANLVFGGEETAISALQHFTLSSKDNTFLPQSQLRAAKTLSTHTGSSLYVRLAAITDQKRPRAYEASRFYMMHPEHDPREQGRRESSRGNGGYRRREYSDNEHRRRKRRDKEEGFDASMYDDGGLSSRHGSTSSLAERGTEGNRKARLHGDSYRPPRDERNGVRTSRDRSASPNARNRHTPPPTYRSRDPHPFPQENKGKELFPSTSRSDSDADRNGKDLFSSKMVAREVSKAQYSTKPALAAPNGKDLFSNKIRAAEVKKELFPHKIIPIKHSRSDAFDAADETADLFANGMSVPFMNGSSSRPTNRLRYSGLQSQNDDGDASNGLNIRGASREQDLGFSIRGGAAVNAMGTIKELFPGKAVGNAGKELFAEKVEGRGGRRNRAEDMFY